MRNSLLGFAVLFSLSEGLSASRSVESLRDENAVNVSFKLYTSPVTQSEIKSKVFCARKNMYDGVTLIPGDINNLLASGFQGSMRTIIITHGYNDDMDTEWIRNGTKEVLFAEDANVITLDWSECAKNIIYNEVIECMKEAGLRTGRFLQFLRDAGKFDLDRAHLIGHSLGAHLMGFAGQVFPVERSVGRITGLDPAGPLFEHAPESERLNTKAAKFVDVIHTCRVFLGMKKPIGTVDFYPNGGYDQVGCDNLDLRCHHAMSQEYFIRTISRTTYVAKKCNTLENAVKGNCEGETAVMGYRPQYRTPGIYYVRIG